MDKTLLREIIKDFENVSKVVNFRLEQLRSMLGETSNRSMGDTGNKIKESIEQQRHEMMQKIEEMRKQASVQVHESVGNISVPGFGMPGMNQMPMASAEIENMKKQMLEKINRGNKVNETKYNDDI